LVAPRLFRQVEVRVQTDHVTLGGVLQSHTDLTVADLAERAAVLSLDPHRMAALLGKTRVVHDEQAIGLQHPRQVLGELIADGAFAPRALDEELLQALFIVFLAVVDALQAFGHGAGAFTPAIEQQAAEVAFGPGTSPVTTEVREHVIQVAGEITLKAVQAFGVHSTDRLWTAAQLATTTNGVILVQRSVNKVSNSPRPGFKYLFYAPLYLVSGGSR
jgi:hypothetical protein